MKFTRKLATAVTLGAALGLGAVPGDSPAAGSMPESDKPIRLALNEWTGQHITTRIAGEVLKKMGYNVEYTTAGYIPQLEGIARGDISATLELWEQTIGEHYDKAIGTGKVVSLGDTGVVTKEGFIYPPYLEEVCPGLPAYEALNDCAKELATADTYPKGRVIDYPVDWDPDTSQRLEALGINFTAQPPGSEGAAVAEIRSAVARKRPILVTFWKPHWLFSKFDMNWVDLPQSAPECYEDPSWGTNADMTHDCGWPAGWVRKVAWKGMADTWPGAYEFLKIYQINNDIQARLMYEVDVEDKPAEKAVAEWMTDNEETWRQWVDQVEGS